MSANITQFENTNPRSLADMVRLLAGERLAVTRYGARPDGVLLSDGAINNSSTTFTSATADFTTGVGDPGSVDYRPSDIGKTIWIEGAGVPGSSYTQTLTQTTTTARDLLTTITAVNSPTSIEVADASSADVSNVESRYGTDNTTFIQLAFDEALNHGFLLYFPSGKYLTTNSLTLRSQLSLEGCGYTYEAWKSVAASMLMCCADVPVLNGLGENEADGWNGGNISALTFRGTRRPGSKGIYSAYTLGALIHHCSFAIFGDQAIHLDTFGLFGIHVHDCSQTDSCLVDDRTEYVGCFDFGPSDLFIARLECAGPGIFWGPDLYGSGKIAGIKFTGNNSFAADCISAGAQIGYYIGPVSPTVQLTTTFTNLRADQNQGHGFVIDAFSCHFIGCRSHNNGMGADATYDGFHTVYGTHQFTGCQSTKTAVPLDHPTQGFNFKYRDHFNFDVGTDFFAPSHVTLPFVGDAYSGNPTNATHSRDIVHTVAPTRQPVVLLSKKHGATNRDDLTAGIQLNVEENSLFFEASDGDADTRIWAVGPNVVPGLPNVFAIAAFNDDRDTAIAPILIYRNQTTGVIDYILLKDNGGIYIEPSVAFVNCQTFITFEKGIVLSDPAKAVDERRWAFGQLGSSTLGTGALIGVTQNDSTSASVIWLRVNRTAENVDNIQLTAPIIDLLGTVNIDAGGSGVTGAGRITFSYNNIDIVTSSGDPNGVVTANPGSLLLNANGQAWIKHTGTGDTGWENLDRLSSGYALGDLLVGNSSGGFDALNIGSSGRILQVVSGTVNWGKVDLGSSASVSGSGLSAAVVKWDGSKLISISGQTTAIAVVISIGGATDTFLKSPSGTGSAFISLTTTTLTLNFTDGLYTS